MARPKKGRGKARSPEKPKYAECEGCGKRIDLNGADWAVFWTPERKILAHRDGPCLSLAKESDKVLSFEDL